MPRLLLSTLVISAAAKQCDISSFGAIADNETDNTHAFRSISETEGCDEILVPKGVWMTGPFNLSSNTVLRIEGTISGSRNPDFYPIVTQQPLDEAYRAPYMQNCQYQALISSYSARNISVTGGGTVDGNGWDWWRNVSKAVNASNTYFHQRPKLVELVDCTDVHVSNLTLKNSPFWTLHPTFCTNVRISHLHVLAPRDHGNTDGIDPNSCNNVHVSDCVIDVGDDAVSVKSGKHWKTKQKVPAQNYLFERVDILFRNFAIGSDISGDVRNITFRDGTIGDNLGSSPWAIKIKTDSQEGGIADGIFFKNVRMGNITYCGSSKFVFTPPHSRTDSCSPTEKGATMIDVGMGYVGEKTLPGRVRNVVFEDIWGVGPTGSSMRAHGLPNASGCPGCAEHIQNLTLRNITLQTGGPWVCDLVDGVTVEQVALVPKGSTCMKKVD